MKAAVLIIFAVSILGLLLGPVLRRLGSPFGFWISFAAKMILRLTAGVILVATAVIAADKGSVWWIGLAILLGVVGVFSIALTGFLIWGVRKIGKPDDD
ncbi:MAG TPA: hypothetical protein VNH45_16005 [Gaiellaceae bacterium]|nr:hypothetical protein [Gaiellaceae bacterium]